MSDVNENLVHPELAAIPPFEQAMHGDAYALSGLDVALIVSVEGTVPGTWSWSFSSDRGESNILSFESDVSEGDSWFMTGKSPREAAEIVRGIQANEPYTDRASFYEHLEELGFEHDNAAPDWSPEDEE